jgi:hypothetical protein
VADVDATKTWINLGPDAEGEDLGAWCAEAETALREALGDQLAGFVLELRADAVA